MRKRSALIGLLISLMSISSTLMLKYGILFTSSTFVLPLKVNAESPGELYKNGLKKVKETKDYKGAIEDFTKAIEKRSSYLLAYYFRGVAKSFLEDYEGAIADYSKVLKMDRWDREAALDRGRAKYSIGDYEGAISDYRKAIKIDPRYSDAFYFRGIYKDKFEDYKGALADFNKACLLYTSPSPRDDR